MRQNRSGKESRSRTWQTHRCFFRLRWSVAIGSFLSEGFFPRQHVLSQPVTPTASSALSMRQKAANARCPPPPPWEPDKRKRKILSFLMYTSNSINTQRKTFYTNGNNRQNLKLKLRDPDSTHNGHGWNELIITPRGGLGSHGQGGKDQRPGNKQMRYWSLGKDEWMFLEIAIWWAWHWFLEN